MQEQSPFSNTSPTDSPKTFWQLHKKILLIVIVFVVLLLGAVAAGRLYKHGQPSDPSATDSEHSLTLYYRDGKTVFWKSDKSRDWLPYGQSGFVGLVIDELKDKIGYDKLKQGAWQVTTTLDSSLQSTAAQQLAAQQSQFNKQGVKNTALIAQDITNGQIVSWVGGLESAGKTDDAVTQKAEVGTLALPLSYAALIEHTPSINGETTLDDTREVLPGYPCTNVARPNVGGNCLYNFDYTFAGQTTLRQALGTLRLVPAVKASKQLLGSTGDSAKLQTFAEGLTNNGKFACYSDESLSSTSESACYTAAVFGDGLFATPKDTIEAYATLANYGKKSAQTGVLKAAMNGKTTYEWRPQSTKQAMHEATARVVNGILTDSRASYLPESYKDVFSVGDTKIGVAIGTEHESKVASTIQFSSKYAVGVWVFGDQEGIKGTSETLVLPMAAEWIRAAQ